MTEAAAGRAREREAEATAAETAWFDPAMAALRLRLERRILWLRGAPWIDDRLHGYGDQVVSDTRADRSEEHTSELQSLMRISYAVFCLKKKIQKNSTRQHVS